MWWCSLVRPEQYTQCSVLREGTGSCSDHRRHVSVNPIFGIQLLDLDPSQHVILD